MHRATIVSLKTLILVMVVLLLACQIFMVPRVAEQTAEMYPEFGYLQAPGILIGVLFLLCVQVTLVCVWRLLSLVREASIFSADAFAWVDVIIGAVVLATLLIGGSFAALVAAGVGSPSVIVLCALGVVVGAALALLIAVMRGLLRKAFELERDLAEVV